MKTAVVGPARAPRTFRNERLKGRNPVTPAVAAISGAFPEHDPPTPDGWRFVHEWFAGWRWEHHRDGALLAESLQNFETREECVADATRHGHGTGGAITPSVPSS